MKRQLPWILLTLIIAVLVITTPSEAQTTNAPILIVYKNSTDGKFGQYLGELLHAEGLNEFDMVEISGINGVLLSQYQVVILGKGSLTPGQAGNLTTYVNNGGGLIAMQPDDQIKSLFGLNAASGQQTNGYLKFENGAVINGHAPGLGLTDQTLQNHGSANRYTTTAGAVILASLFSDAVTPTVYPAVLAKATGSGWAVAYTYDLPQNIIYTRQGNPANADTDIDGDGIFRTIDLFQSPPAWLDLNKVPIPQADEQVRFLGRLIKALSSSPLPQLWYFPGTTKTMLVITSDAHANPPSYYTNLLSDLSTNGAHATFYLSEGADPAKPVLDNWITAGHSFGIHPYPELSTREPPITTLTEGYTFFDDWFQSQYAIPKSPTVRHHTLGWQGWTQAVNLENTFGIRMDTNFYHWGPWLKKLDGSWAHGYITGSGLPMKFASLGGTILPVYQQLTQLADEQLVTGIGDPDLMENLSGQDAFLVSKALIDASQSGYYSAVMTQFHVDYYDFNNVEYWGNATMGYAQSLEIPRWSADEWLAYIETRDAAVYRDLAWNPATGIVSFLLDAPTVTGQELTTLLPMNYSGDKLLVVTVDGAPAVFEPVDVNGIQMAFITVPAGSHNFSGLYSHAQADLSITISDAPDPVTAGQQINYTIVVNNSGPDVAQNVTVTNNLPSGTSFGSVTTSQGSCSGTTTVVCNLGAISNGGSVSIELVVNVNPGQRSGISNSVTVSANSTDSNPANNTSTTSTSVIASADVGVTISDSPDPVTAGNNLVYTLTAKNNGPSTATGVSLVLTLDSGVNYLSFSGLNWTCSEAPVGTLTCTRSGSLNVLAEDTMAVTVKVAANHVTGLSSAVSVNAVENDSVTSNDHASAATQVNRKADMALTVSDNPDPVTAGTNLVYTLTAKNNGPSTASGVTLALTLDPGTSYQTYSGTNWTCAESPVGTVNCTRSGTLDVLAEASVNITVKVDPAESGVLTSSTSVSATELDPVIGNNQPSVNTTVDRQADVSISISDSPDPVAAGQDLTYTLTIQNAGPSSAEIISVADILPAGVVYQSASGLGWTCVENAGSVNCNHQPLLPGYNETVQIVVTSPNAAVDLENNASIIPGTPDFNPGNNQDLEFSTVTLPVDLSVEIKAVDDPARAGMPLELTLTVTNVGVNNATGVNATVIIPIGSTFISADGTGWICNFGAGTITCTLDHLVAGNTGQITILITAPLTGSNFVTIAAVSSESGDPVLGNNSMELTTSLMHMQYLPVISSVP